MVALWVYGLGFDLAVFMTLSPRPLPFSPLPRFVAYPVPGSAMPRRLKKTFQNPQS